MIIYKITNEINGMVYVGRTKQRLDTRYRQHCRDAKGDRDYQKFKLHRAMLEFGTESFRIEQIDTASSADEANTKEVEWIKRLDAIANGYNTSPGGRNGANFKRVENIETGIVYNSIEEAGGAMGVSASAIRQATKNPTWTCCGYHWQLLES